MDKNDTKFGKYLTWTRKTQIRKLVTQLRKLIDSWTPKLIWTIWSCLKLEIKTKKWNKDGWTHKQWNNKTWQNVLEPRNTLPDQDVAGIWKLVWD